MIVYIFVIEIHVDSCLIFIHSTSLPFVIEMYHSDKYFFLVNCCSMYLHIYITLELCPSLVICRVINIKRGLSLIHDRLKSIWLKSICDKEQQLQHHSFDFVYHVRVRIWIENIRICGMIAHQTTIYKNKKTWIVAIIAHSTAFNNQKNLS